MRHDKFIFPGNIAPLTVLRAEPDGVWLKNADVEVLLPSHEVRGDENPGDELEVFIYTNEKSLQFATRKFPPTIINEIGFFRIVTVTANGAFAKWNVPVDLFIPQSELQFEPVRGRSYLVGVRYNTKSGKLYGTTRLNELVGFVENNYKRGDVVNVVIAEHQKEGKRVIVENKFWGILESKDIFSRVSVGDKMKLFVERRERDLLFLTPHNPMESSVDDAREKIMGYLEANRGYARLTDDTPPEEINLRLKMSKKTFKRAIGMLYSSGHITITPRGIKKNAVVTPPPKKEFVKEDRPKKTVTKIEKKTIKRVEPDLTEKPRKPRIAGPARPDRPSKSYTDKPAGAKRTFGKKPKATEKKTIKRVDKNDRPTIARKKPRP